MRTNLWPRFSTESLIRRFKYDAFNKTTVSLTFAIHLASERSRSSRLHCFRNFTPALFTFTSISTSCHCTLVYFLSFGRSSVINEIFEHYEIGIDDFEFFEIENPFEKIVRSFYEGSLISTISRINFNIIINEIL